MNKESALNQVQRHIARVGRNVAFYFRNNADVTTDIYGDAKSLGGSIDFTVKAFPIRYSPNRQQIDAAGLREMVDAIIYTAKKDWNDAGAYFDRMPLESSRAVFDSHDYEIKEKALVSQHEDDYAYITFGLVKSVAAHG